HGTSRAQLGPLRGRIQRRVVGNRVGQDPLVGTHSATPRVVTAGRRSGAPGGTPPDRTDGAGCPEGRPVVPAGTTRFAGRFTALFTPAPAGSSRSLRSAGDRRRVPGGRLRPFNRTILSGSS